MILLVLSIGCTQQDTSQLDNAEEQVSILQEQITNKEIAVQELNDDVILLKESEDYLRKQKTNVEKEKENLQEYYNKLFTDATSCYWANACAYRPTSCVEHFKDVLTGWTGEEIHIYYSDQCDTMVRDWDSYVELDTSDLGDVE